jgi:acyl carrier protein
MTAAEFEAICLDLCGFLSSNILADGVEIEPATSLALVGVDSFSLLEIIMFIERKYGVTLPESDLIPENLSSVQSLAQCLKARIADA